MKSTCAGGGMYQERPLFQAEGGQPADPADEYTHEFGPARSSFTTQ